MLCDYNPFLFAEIIAIISLKIEAKIVEPFKLSTRSNPAMSVHAYRHYIAHTRDWVIIRHFFPAIFFKLLNLLVKNSKIGLKFIKSCETNRSSCIFTDCLLVSVNLLFSNQ